ncbi:MAG: hypothetical protein SGI72_16610 [Planctomycetota bacterium]|nr:hypothetical protein [Planctomycetota bacterium]
MKSVWLTSVVLSTCIGAAQASDLNVRTQSPWGAVARVAPGATVPFSIEGELSDSASAGLGLFTFDLAFTGGPLIPLGTPTTAPMNNFSAPKGFVNPAGFGGTLQGGVLRQIGGGQNTIRNTLAATPNGTVILNVAQSGAPVSLAAGQLTAPYITGSYSLAPSNVLATAIQSGQGANPLFWKVDHVGQGAIAPLTVIVQAVRPTRSTVRPANNEQVAIVISAGPANAGRQYQMVGSWSGTTPGVPLPGGLTLPLNNDRYLEYTTAFPNGPILKNSQGVLDADGRAVVTFKPTIRFVGLTVNHAFYLLGPTNFVSEAEAIVVLP